MQKGPLKVGSLKSISYAATEGEDLSTVDFTCPYDSTMGLVWGCLISLVIPGSLYHGVSQLCLVSTCDFRAISARFSVHPWLNGGRKKRLGSRRCIHFIERKTWKNYERTNGGPMGSGWTKTKNWSNCRGIPRFQTLNTKPDASWLQAPRKSSFHFPCSLAQVVSNWLGHQSVLN